MITCYIIYILSLIYLILGLSLYWSRGFERLNKNLTQTYEQKKCNLFIYMNKQTHIEVAKL